ncbi:SAPS-domain-containing protein [Daedalea quercina L-15889]|uniref:SAPS-domain-containing protein n=1 Tax=Daedalea quercina L-15889 TaxID=1314783 RepID=A0A165QYN2_9APHY|nr:SAPS-domain-containing protein [Daedalea quercina L-15889]
MFWRFGFHNASTIDSLLDKEDVSLEAILDEDDLLQECKAQNTRLVSYFQRIDVLQRLLGYVTGQIEGEDRGRFKYPYVSTEVLCSEIWTIVETCLNNQDQLLTPFWETVLDRSPEDMKTQMVMASQFAKINAVFLSKKPAEMLAFIRSQPDVVERLLHHIETPAFADLLVRIIQLDEQPAGAGVLEWLSEENLMSRLIDLLSPTHSPDMHTVVAELIKGIISMAAPSPGAGLADNQVPPSNCFARELAHRDSVSKLVSYILCDFGPMTAPEGSEQLGTEPTPADSSRQSKPDPESAASSVVQSICIIIELIRQNNSDYFEPYLFHTLRNRLIQIQQQLQMNRQGGREALEAAFNEMVNRMGVVHLGPLLEIMCDKIDALQQFLRQPRSMHGHVLTTVGELTPLTFERYRICELYAELLHASNMSLLNRPREYDNLYDASGRLQGGLSALEQLAQVIAIGSGGERDEDDMDDDEGDEAEPAHDFPVHNAQNDSSSLLDSDEDMSGDDEPGSSDDDAMEEITMYEEPRSNINKDSLLTASPLSRSSPLLSSSPSTSSTSLPNLLPSSNLVPSPGTPPATSDVPAITLPRQNSWNSGSDTDTLSRPRSSSSRRSLRRHSTLDVTNGRPVLGERLKQRFLEANVVSTLLDLFFDFPWNNFLHSVVYDLVHQILTGRIDGGFNRELTVALFRDARLMHRIIEGSKRNDQESAKPKGVRLGYMGHLTLISEDVIGALEHFPPDLRLLAAQYAPQPEWDEYVTGRYKETKKKDTILLGGGKPVVAPGMRNGSAASWRVDEADTGAGLDPQDGGQEPEGQMKGEFRRTAKMREGSADFGAMDDDDDDEFSRAGPPHFAQYLAQEMQSAEHFESADEASDDEEEDGGWLAHSTFDLRPPPVSARQHEADRRPLSTTGFDDSFAPSNGQSTSGGPFEDPFDDDAFGPFSDTAAASGSDPFTFSSSSSPNLGAEEHEAEHLEDASFDSFGDFGDFQSAESGSADGGGAGSWSFASTSSTGSGSLDEFGGGSPQGKERTQ